MFTYSLEVACSCGKDRLTLGTLTSYSWYDLQQLFREYLRGDKPVKGMTEPDPKDHLQIARNFSRWLEHNHNMEPSKHQTVNVGPSLFKE